MANKAAIVNVAHGNEPYILGVSLAKRISHLAGEQFDIVVPNLYPGRQDAILKERFGQDPHIFLDYGLGRVVKPLAFYNQSFQDHLEEIIDYQEIVQKEAASHVAKGFSAVSLEGLEKTFSRNDVALELNAGSKICLGIEPRIYVFYFFNSDVLRATLHYGGLGFDTEKLKMAGELLGKQEEMYPVRLITALNPFTGIEFKPKPATQQIPVPKQRTYDETPIEIEIERGVYVLISGTGMCREQLIEQSKQLGIKAYYSTNALPLREETETLPFAKAIGNPNIIAVFHRGGLGTGSECLVNGKPQLLLPYQEGDDPEVFFDIMSYTNLGLGMEHKGQPINEEQLQMLAAQAEKVREGLQRQFGREDGITYAARLIMQKTGL